MKCLIFPVLFFLISAVSVCAQISVGVRGGVLYNVSHVPESGLFKGSSLTRLSGGLCIQYMLPGDRFGFDASVMYSQRGKTILVDDEDNDWKSRYDVFTRDYIDVPINFIWKITRTDIINPYLFTGPMFGFNIGSNEKLNIDINPFVFSWNVGVGLEIIKRFRLSYTYCLGISNSESFNVKDRGSLVTVGYLFAFEKENKRIKVKFWQ